MAKQNLGMVTAYAYAVVGGYEGTEAEFESLLGNIATDLAEIENLTVIANTLPSGSSATASYDHGVLTLGIPKGDKGDTGAGATVTAGTTTTGNPGTNASVTNSGTTKDAVFNFTIPRGDTGNGIESIYLTGTSGAVKTYTILYTDGNTTNFDVTDGEVTNATLTAVLADYAKIDGAYESMTVGNAEQLVSTVFVNDEEPYNFRTSGGSADIGDREYDTIVGGTVGWNQLVLNGDFSDGKTNWTASNMVDSWSVTDNVATINALAASDNTLIYQSNRSFVSGHKYLVLFSVKESIHSATARGYIYSTATSSKFYGYLQSGWNDCGVIVEASSTQTAGLQVGIRDGSASAAFSYYMKNINLIDLTAMFGSTIADYIYSLETADAGAGVAWFRKLFPKDYYEYNTGELMSVNTSAHITRGFNAWDEEWEVGGINSNTGEPLEANDRIRSKNYSSCFPNTNYYCRIGSSGVSLYAWFYDADKNFISGAGVGNRITTFPNNARYFKLSTYGGNYSTYNHDICINLSWDGERDGEYEEYVKHSYPLDSSLTLRGIPKLDASNNLYYDGDVYESDGSVTRKYGIVDLGTLTWIYDGDEIFRAPDTRMKFMGNGICTKYKWVQVSSWSQVGDGEMSVANSEQSPILRIHDSTAGTDAAAFKTAMNGVYLVYELATPTTESADPFQSPQIVDDFGTEEYVDYAVSQGSRDVAIPVGHVTKYTNNLRAKLEMSPNSPDGAGDYLVRQTNGINEYVSLSSNATIQDMLARIEALEGGGE